MRTAAAAAIAAIGTAAAAAIVFVFKIGPVIVTLTDSHGIHIGDLAGAAVAAAGWAAAWAVLRSARTASASAGSGR